MDLEPRCPRCNLVVRIPLGKCPRCQEPLPLTLWYHCRHCRWETSCRPDALLFQPNR